MLVQLHWVDEEGRRYSMENPTMDVLTVKLPAGEGATVVTVRISGVPNVFTLATKTISVIELESSPILPRRDANWAFDRDSDSATASFAIKRSKQYLIVKADGETTTVLFQLSH